MFVERDDTDAYQWVQGLMCKSFAGFTLGTPS